MLSLNGINTVIYDRLLSAGIFFNELKRCTEMEFWSYEIPSWKITKHFILPGGLGFL